MTWHVIDLNSVAPTPWRNGGGTTRELHAWPDSATWQWRASVAEVAQDGPFSSCAGVKRWFAVLDGDGVCLTVDGYQHVLTKNDQPFAFDGTALTTCELLGGATQDFNLMVQGATSAGMLRIKDDLKMMINTPKIVAAYTHKETAMVYIGSKSYELKPHSFGWIEVPATTAVHVLAIDALLMEIDT